MAVADTRGSLADPASLAQALGECLRLLRPGGRCVVVGRDAHAPPEIGATLQGRGYRAARLLAERNGWWFAEALKGR
jgi:ubiquinone/menaquinone biosynthesis C-methylase UbiE